MPSKKPLADQVVVITGASSGIGLLAARTLAAAGARVLLVARSEAALRDAAAAIGARADYAVADVGDADQVRAAAAAAIARFGRIDTWVNNAGVAIYAKLTETPADEHERLFRTNYFGVVNGCLAALPALRDSGGTLITVGSIASDLPSAVLGAYSASKHAAKGYLDSLRIELNAERAGVDVVLVKPAGMATPIAEHAANHGPGEAQIPPPVYDAQLVADAIARLAVRPEREVNVGGVGLLQTLVAVHAPGLLARFGGLLAPALFDRAQAPTPRDNLAAPVDAGRARPDDAHGRPVSALAVAQRVGPAAAGLAAGAGLLAFVAARRLLHRR